MSCKSVSKKIEGDTEAGYRVLFSTAAKFSLRGLKKVKGEWNLVTMAWNVRRMFTLMPA